MEPLNFYYIGVFLQFHTSWYMILGLVLCNLFIRGDQWRVADSEWKVNDESLFRKGDQWCSWFIRGDHSVMGQNQQHTFDVQIGITCLKSRGVDALHTYLLCDQVIIIIIVNDIHELVMLWLCSLELWINCYCE